MLVTEQGAHASSSRGSVASMPQTGQNQSQDSYQNQGFICAVSTDQAGDAET
jgi:hypothetical protein